MFLEKFRAACPQCGYQTSLDVEVAGQEICCFMCGKTFRAATPSIPDTRQGAEAAQGESAGTQAARPVETEGTLEQAEAEVIGGANTEMVQRLRCQSTWRLLVLTVITLGIYAAHYMKRQARILNEYLRPEQQISAVFVGAILLLAYASVMLVVPCALLGEGHPIEAVDDALNTICSILFIVWGFKARNRMNGLLGATGRDTAWFRGLWTFLWTPFYFNLKVNSSAVALFVHRRNRRTRGSNGRGP